MGMSAGTPGEDDAQLISEINITPMVDVMLVLLIIFMVTAPAIFTPGIQIDMPEAKTAENVQEKEFSVLVDRDGNWYLNGKAASRDAVAGAVEEARAEGQEPIVLVGADKETAHKEVIGVLDYLRELGVYKFALNTAPPAPESAER